MKIILRGRLNDLELGRVKDGTYTEMGLLADEAHRWKILEWIDQGLSAGEVIRVVKVPEDMMETSKAKNKTALDKIVKGAFRNTK